MEQKQFKVSASELCSLLQARFPNQVFKSNWIYRDLIQHDDEIRGLGVDYCKTKSNGIRSICVDYNADRDSSGGILLCAENGVPADPVPSANADISSQTADASENDIRTIAVPTDGDKFIEWVANDLSDKLKEQGIPVQPFQPREQDTGGFCSPDSKVG